MALLMICSAHCVYVDLREHMQLERFLPLHFNRILIFLFPFLRHSHLCSGSGKL